MVAQGASDLHLSSDEYPFLRKDGVLVRQDDAYSTALDLEEVARELMNESQNLVAMPMTYSEIESSANPADAEWGFHSCPPYSMSSVAF